MAAAGAAFDAGDPARATECFIDCWIGPGAWRQTPEARKAPIAASVANVRGWAAPLIHEPTPLASLAALDLPVLCMVGRASPASSRGVARLLAVALRRVEVIEFEGMGHRGPITHPSRVNEAIARFLSN